MVLIYVKVRVSNHVKPKLRTELELLVDTGSMLTWIPRKTMEGLDVTLRGTRQFRTIEGKVIKREKGVVAVECEGLETVAEVVFADESYELVMEVTTLESLGFRVNPLTGKLDYIGLLAV